MTSPPPDGARPDLMLPIGALSDAAGRDVILSGGDAGAVLAYCRAMGSKFGAPGYLRYLFGLPVNEALQSGYEITQRALRETTPHACAEEIARTVLELLPDADDGRAGRQFSVVHLDPPWRGSYQYDLTRPFMLEDLAFNVAELVGLGLESAGAVVLSLPHNAVPSQIGELAARLGCNAVIQYQFISDFPASFSQAPAYFFGRSGAGHDGRAGVGERHQKLTVDGRRAG